MARGRYGAFRDLHAETEGGETMKEGPGKGVRATGTAAHCRHRGAEGTTHTTGPTGAEGPEGATGPEGPEGRGAAHLEHCAEVVEGRHAEAPLPHPQALRKHCATSPGHQRRYYSHTYITYNT